MIDKFLLKKKLIRFLKDNDCYKLFCINIESNCHYFESFDNLISFSSMYKNRNEIINAFEWDKTKEGFDFWHKKMRKWQKEKYNFLNNKLT